MRQRLGRIKQIILLVVLMMVLTTPVKVHAFTVNKEEVQLYSISSKYEESLTIPEDSEHLKEFQIVVSGTDETPSYKVLYQSQTDYNGNDYKYNAVNVSESGLVTPGYTRWYWSGGFGTTAYNENATSIEDSPNTGAAVVRVTVGDEYHDILFRHSDYAPVYTEECIDSYIDENITDEMTVKEVAEKAAQYAASFDYDYHYSSALGMIINGGGDCWASTDLIIKVCKKCGLNAWSRNGNRDSGAGSGHMNALVEAESGSLWYEVEAGYSMSKSSTTGLRPYSVRERTSLYCYRVKSSTDKTIEVYQYDGNDTSVKVLEVPEKIGDYTVISVGDKFIQQNSYVEEVILPDTLTNIGSSAFNSCSSLKKLNIPAAVSTIGEFAFTNCNKLEELTIDEDNENYTIIDGVIYDKNVTKLIAAPYVSEIVIPDTVTTVGEYSVYYNKNLTSVKFGENVTVLEEGAFGDCSSLSEITMNEKVEEIGSNALRNTSKLTQVVIPESVNTIGDYGLYGTGAEVVVLTTDAEIGKDVVNSSTQIYCLEGSTMAAYASENESAKITACSQTEIEDKLDPDSSSGEDSEGGNTDVDKPKEGTEGEGTDVDKPKEGTEGEETDVDKPKEGTEGEGTDVDKPKEGTEGEGTDVDKPKEGTGGEGTDVDKPKEGTEGEETDVDKQKEGTEGENTDVDKPKEGTEGEGTDVDKPKEGTEGEETDVDKQKEGTEGENTDVDKPKEGTEGEGTEVDKPKEGTESEGTDVDKPKEGTGGENTDVGKPRGDAKDEKVDVQNPDEVTNNKSTNTEKTDEKVNSENNDHLLNVGDTFVVGKNKCTYKVISTDSNNPAVTFVKTGSKKITSISIPASVVYEGVTYKVTKVSAGALKKSKRLKLVVVGENIDEIGKDAFKNCKALKTINIKTVLLGKKSIGKNAIKGTSKNLVIKVPKSKKASYKAIFKGKGNNKAKVR